MNRKRIRQMNTALLRRLTGRPTAEYFSGQPLLERLESENYIQRFAPLYDGTRLRCGDVLELCRPELAELSGGEPEGGWLRFGGWGLPGIWWSISITSTMKGIICLIWFMLIKKKALNYQAV